MGKKDDWISITISDDKMEVYASFFPSSYARPSVDNVLSVLSEKGVVLGVDVEQIRKAIDVVNTSQKAVMNVLIARGASPKMGRRALLCIYFPTSYRQASATEEEAVNFKELGGVTVVRSGEVIAHVSNEIEPVEGKNVFGKTVKPPSIDKRPFRFGKGVILNGDNVVSRLVGEPVLDELFLDVVPVLKIERDVDYHTGNVRFPGSVIINGSVKDGFTVAAGKDISVGGNIEGARVFSGGSITVKGGIIARGQGKIWASKGIMAKFVENAYIEAGGDVIVERAILHSTVKTHAWIRVKVKRPGSIIGGSVWAFGGVEAYNLGSDFGTPTEVVVGMDYMLADRLKRIENDIKRLEPVLERITKSVSIYKDNKNALNLLGDTARKKLKKLLVEYKLLSSKLTSLERRRSEVRKMLLSHSKSYIRIKDTVFEGVKVCISGYNYTVRDKLQYVEFFLNKEGKVDFRPYE
ncbi:MAG: DUF342 domain-containing protein [Synergistetes bacterium]|nr:DUF342 domain-containing protein [Synergistota bacterium]